MTKLIHHLESLRAEIAQRKHAGEVIALVPTMGALHEGHLSLMRQAHEVADKVVVSIFVNPAQFGPNEDFDTYPRDLDDDMEKLQAEGVDLVYAPAAEEMYPQGVAIEVKAKPSLVTGLCAAFRPGFFDGVATVVAKLLKQVEPHIAIFGQKDYQQLQVIKHMVREQELPVKILSGPIVRETDGLAMSSRNAYMSKQERMLAPKLHQVLIQTCEALQTDIAPALARAEQALLEAGFTKVDYVSLVDAETLQSAESLELPTRLLVAAWIGKTRLIDNIAVEPAAHE